MTTETVEIKIADATSVVLNYIVAIAEGWIFENLADSLAETETWTHNYCTDPAQARPIIDREMLAVWPDIEGGYFASTDEGRGDDYHGDTELIAAMRCFAISKLGETTQVPTILLPA